MLLSFRCKNFRSIRDYITFTTLAVPSFMENANDLIITGQEAKDERSAIRFAGIYGANASGKTNILRAIYHMAEQVKTSGRNESGGSVAFCPHKLSDDSELSEFSIWFVKDGVKYFYSFACNARKFAEESLYVYSNGEPVKVFERQDDEVSYGQAVSIRQNEMSFRLKPNRLVLSIAGIGVSDCPSILKAYEFFSEDVIFIDPEKPKDWGGIISLGNGGKKRIDKEKLELAVGVMRLFFPSLKDINIEQKSLSKEQISELQMHNRRIDVRGAQYVTVETDYGLFSVRIEDESYGTKSVFNAAPRIISALLSDKVVLWDEIERGLHPVIARKFIETFCENRETNSQIIATTHNTDLLDLSVMRRDQVWFAEMKDDDRSTDVYSLAEIKHVQSDENIKKGYLEGKYGAIPIISGSFLKGVV